MSGFTQVQNKIDNSEINWDTVNREMLKTEQTKGQTVFQHGQSVWEYVQDLLNYMKGGVAQKSWRIPAWLENYKDDILANIHDEWTFSNYARFHDCGKPYCKTVDDDGQAHFPDHAETSSYVWMKLDGNETVGNLIRWDMVLHTSSADDIKRYIEQKWNIKDAITLLVAALAELHSNASMFGGIESVSFKSKWKKLDRRGKQLCKHYFEKGVSK